MKIVRKLFDLLSSRERVRLGVLFVAVLVVAFLEAISVASVFPFLSIAADPRQVETNAWLSWAYETLHFSNTDGFLLALAGAALFALVLSNACMAATNWAQLRFSRDTGHRLSVRLLHQYLGQPYVFFLGRNSADLAKNILTEVEQVTAHVLMPLLRGAAKSLVVLAIVALLIALDPLLALVVTAVLGGAYGAISLYVRRRLTRLGKARVAANRARFKAADEAFGAVKDLKLLGREDVLLRRFISPSNRFNRCTASALIIGEIPRYALEVLAFGGVLVVASYLILRGEGLQQAIPMLGLYAFAGYRLMPSLQQVFLGYTKLRFGAPALENLHRELTHASPGSQASAQSLRGSKRCASKVLPLTDRLELDGVTYTYPGAQKPALRAIRLTIEANTTIGIVGPTGSGKTTLIDIVLGLLRPQAGTICVDGLPLTDANLRAWQNGLGYVAQHIYLTDDTIARNIAFGIPDTDIDSRAVERAARIANVHEFILRELPEGYDTVVGEGGIRLSGGQRQRLGIARALYHDPPVLIFDEATSALDHDTEAAVMEAINELTGTRTMLIVAHRLTTLQGCDALLRVQAGQCTYEMPRQKSGASTAVAV